MKNLKTIFIFIFFLFVSIPSFSQIRTSTAPGIYIQEEDGSPASRFRTIKVTNDALTDNGDGSATIATGGGGSCWEEDDLNDLQPVSASCTDTLWEEDGSSDLMPQA